jgi:exonuclease SbcC
VNAESLEEEALNTAKAMVNREIERLTENISNHKGEIIRLQSLIDNYKDQHDVVFAKLTEAMSTIPDWEDRYKNSTLSDDLTVIAKTWNENDVQRISLAEQLSTKSSELTTLQHRQVELIDNLSKKQNKQATVISELGQFQNARKELLEGKSADEVEQLHKKKLVDVDNQVNKTMECRNELIATGKTLEGVISQLIDSTSRLKQEIENLNKNISDWLLNREDELTREQLTQLLAQESSWLTVERTALKALTDAELSAQTKLTERQSRANEHQKRALKPAEEESKESLTTIKEEKEQYVNQKRERITEIGVLFANHKKGTERIKQFEKELTDKSLIAENWCKLNDLFGSASGDKFKVLAQGYTLDVLLGYANTHLKDISQRYLLERVSPDSLSLQVVDLDMLSEVRSVHSLSGGESFLISLSLALGLSSLSSNRMRVESLFIDEGFGSLDADTLRMAMDALERLQTQGRKIGIISHVAEMTERIPTQIQVVKTVNGKSRIEIKGINR